MNNSSTLPSPTLLIDEFGGEEFLRIMVKARLFIYEVNNNLAADYYSKVIELEDYLSSTVEFSMGFEKKWVCKLSWYINTYKIELRPLPTTKCDHTLYSCGATSVGGIKDILLNVTGLAICF